MSVKVKIKMPDGSIDEVGVDPTYADDLRKQGLLVEEDGNPVAEQSGESTESDPPTESEGVDDGS